MEEKVMSIWVSQGRIKANYSPEYRRGMVQQRMVAGLEYHASRNEYRRSQF
jgi:hypothetical protein